MKGKKIDRHWGWDISFANTRLLYISNGQKISGGARTLYCLEGLANLFVNKEGGTDILLLAPNQYYTVENYEIEAKENTLLIEVSDEKRF